MCGSHLLCSVGRAIPQRASGHTFVQLDLIRLDRDSAGATHDITRVDHKIQDHLLDLARIGEMELTERVNRDDN